MRDDTGVRQLAEEHVGWLISFLVLIVCKVGIDEFMHGYKHGVQDAEKEKVSNDNKTNR